MTNKNMEMAQIRRACAAIDALIRDNTEEAKAEAAANAEVEEFDEAEEMDMDMEVAEILDNVSGLITEAASVLLDLTEIMHKSLQVHRRIHAFDSIWDEDYELYDGDDDFDEDNDEECDDEDEEDDDDSDSDFEVEYDLDRKYVLFTMPGEPADLMTMEKALGKYPEKDGGRGFYVYRINDDLALHFQPEQLQKKGPDLIVTGPVFVAHCNPEEGLADLSAMDFFQAQDFLARNYKCLADARGHAVKAYCIRSMKEVM